MISSYNVILDLFQKSRKKNYPEKFIFSAAHSKNKYVLKPENNTGSEARQHNSKQLFETLSNDILLIHK